MAISGLNLPTVPGLDCEDFGLVDPLGLCPMAGLWRLNLVPSLGLPIVVLRDSTLAVSGLHLFKAPGLECEDLGLVGPLGLCPMAGRWRLNRASCAGPVH